MADWTASGSFYYADREFDESGFTGAEPPSPIRVADVEVVDANATGKNTVLATGSTDSMGNYSILVSDDRTRDVYVRVLTRSANTSSLNQDVRTSASGKPVYYAVTTATAVNHLSSVDIDFGPTVAGIGQGGEAFNIYDQILHGMDYIAAMEGSRPGLEAHLPTIWGLNNGITTASYNSGDGFISLRDSAGYDDTVILHEMGHYIINYYFASDSPGGFHTFAQCDIDIRLAWDEGLATYLGNSARRLQGLPLSNIYLRTNGAPGAGNVIRVADLETDALYNCQGAASEVNIFSFLWDLVDGPLTTDSYPGVDDGIDNLSLDDMEIWLVLSDALPVSTNISLEDFWDGWFESGQAGGEWAVMVGLASRLGIKFHEDSWEDNGVAAGAGTALVNAPSIPATLFRDQDLNGAGEADLDFYSFQASSGVLYTLETLALNSGADTSLRLWDSDGSSLLAVNHDRVFGDKSSRIDWTAPRTDEFFAEVRQGTGSIAMYGNYELLIRSDSFVDVDGDGWDTISDCDDNDPGVNPGVAEICDGLDQNCDGIIDDGFDADVDGYTTCQGDCADGNPSVNPGVEEVPSNGLDDDCNGSIDDAAPVDLVTIVKATWSINQSWLIVEATSSQQPQAVLTLNGFGTMTFDPGRNRYVYGAPLENSPSYVTVSSSLQGTATAVVVNPAGGGGSGEDEGPGSSCDESEPGTGGVGCAAVEPIT